MNTKIVCFSLCALLLVACAPSDTEQAQVLVQQAQTLVNNGQWRQARIVLDSVHATYPREVAQRRLAKALGDSITYLEAQSTLAYADSMQPPLLEQSDKLLKQFKYEKETQYEDKGRYVHRLLHTNSNTARNFLQAYVRDDRQTIVKSYYYGSYQVNQQQVTLSAQGEEVHFSGSNHAFEVEGWHEIMTLEDENALQLLNFISAHHSNRVRVHGAGLKPTHTWVYYLNDKEKEALSATYQLGFLMKDIMRLEQMANTARNQIAHYERKYLIGAPATE